MSANNGHIDPDKALKARFLREFEACAMPVIVCRRIGIKKYTLDAWLKADVDFRREYDEIRAAAIESIEASLIVRAVEGSDRAAMFVLRALDREKYGDRITVNGDVAVKIYSGVDVDKV